MKIQKWSRALVAAVLAVSVTAGTLPVSAAGELPVTDAAVSVVAASSDSVQLITCNGALESAYAEWGAVTNATGYNVYADGTQIDSMLIRQYADRFRADVVGLKAGSHTLKVVPVIGDKEDASKAAEKSVTVAAHDRSGYAFADGHVPGAYKADGTLKDNAIVVYVTNENKDTVTASLNAEGKGNVDCVGVQKIVEAYKKGKETRPIAIRLIGNIGDPANMPKGDLMLDTVTAGMTIEGIGTDATANGWGIVLKNCVDVEVRNVGTMNCNSDEGDNIGLQQSDSYCWVHNCDFFYGDAGSDADQVKGDGALDTKKSHHITHSYNHFFDNGKCNLQGASASDTSNYITYHHNWYDHSDSRHPRVRVATVHVYNNYYDGNAKYGIGSTTGSSVFAENNYFRNCKLPILTAMQGSDLKYAENPDKGTFSGEDGGTIKAYGNYMEGQKDFIPYSADNTSFDAYVASSRDEQVPASVKSKSGGNTYNNFDTASDMYKYTVDAAKDVPSIVMAKAGRVQGGDFKWTFDNAVDDSSSDVNTALKSALVAYDDSIVAIGSGFTSSTDPITTTTTAETQQTAKSTTTTVSVTSNGLGTAVTTTPPDVVKDGDIFCAPNGKGSGKSESDPADVVSAISQLTAGHTIYLLDGTYAFSEMIMIDENNSGTADAPKTIKAYNGADVVFDFSGQGAANGSNRGIVLDGDYWHFYGFEITKAADNGMLLAGNNNTIEMMVFNDNQDTGLQLSRYNTNAASIAEWPSNNLILNCTSKNNCDNATMENADGFAAKLTCGEGNVFDGCMAYNNSDDGWDLFAKTATGPIGVVTIQNSIAFRNGYTEFGEGYGDCDGNGFKLGGSGVGSAHVMKNCLAFENLHCGFTDNNNPKLGSLDNCTSFNNNMEGTGKPNFSCYRCTDDGCDFSDIMSVYDASLALSDSKLKASSANDKYVGTFQNGVYYNSGYYQVDAKTNVGNGDKIGTKLSAGPAASDFISYEKAPAQGTDFHTAWRNADGSLNPGGLYETADSSSFKSMGYHMYNGTVVTPGTTETTQQSGTTTTTETTAATDSSATKGSTTNPPTPGSLYIHNFTADGLNSQFYQITGNLSTSKGSVDYAGLTLTQCLKMESATSIQFNAPADGSLRLVFVEPNATIKVDGTKYTASGDGIVNVDLTAGAHTISKADTANLFYIVYEQAGTSVVTDETTTTGKNSETTGKTSETAAVTESTGTADASETTSESQTLPTTTSMTIATLDTPVETVPEEDILYGDVNVDGKIDLTDAILLNKALAGAVQLTSAHQYANSDCDANGSYDTNDSIVLLRFLVHLINTLPDVE